MAADRKYPEPKVKELIKTWLDTRQAFSWQPVSNGMGVHGIPDRIACLPIVVTEELLGQKLGLFVGIEAKGSHRRGEADGGCSPLQVVRLKEINEAGGFGIVVYSPEELRAFELQLIQLGITTHG